MTDVRAPLTEEIRRSQGEIEDQKTLIKKNAANTVMVGTAEAGMKALHTRLSTLEANLAKL